MMDHDIDSVEKQFMLIYSYLHPFIRYMGNLKEFMSKCFTGKEHPGIIIRLSVCLSDISLSLLYLRRVDVWMCRRVDV